MHNNVAQEYRKSRNKMTSLGFIGATGRLGQELAYGLIKADGFGSFKAFVRNDTDPDKVQVLEELGYEMVTVDFDNAESLEENFKGVKTLVSAIGGGPLWRVETVSARCHYLANREHLYRVVPILL